MKFYSKWKCGDKFFAIDGGKCVEHEVKFYTAQVSKNDDVETVKWDFFPKDKKTEHAFTPDKMFRYRRSLVKSL